MRGMVLSINGMALFGFIILSAPLVAYFWGMHRAENDRAAGLFHYRSSSYTRPSTTPLITDKVAKS